MISVKDCILLRVAKTLLDSKFTETVVKRVCSLLVRSGRGLSQSKQSSETQKGLSFLKKACPGGCRNPHFQGSFTRGF